MKKYILKIDYSKLRKAEIKTFASRVIKIVEKHNPETLKIKEIFDLLVELEPQIDSLDFGFGSHPITLSLSTLRKQRKAFSQGIINQMATIENGKINGMEEALAVAKPITNRLLKGLYDLDDITAYQKVAVFFKDIDRDEILETAFITLNLSSYLDNLRSVNCTIEELIISRGQNISARPKNATPGILAALKNALLDLYKQIEVAHIKHQELDYIPLIDELNEQIAILKATLKARASYYKKKAEGMVDDNEIVVDVLSEEPIEQTTSNMRIYPMNEDVEVEVGNLNNVDKKILVSAKS